MREVDAEALERLDERGYRAGDHIGAIGIERRWESYLRGQRGWRDTRRGLHLRQALVRCQRHAHLLRMPR